MNHDPEWVADRVMDKAWELAEEGMDMLMVFSLVCQQAREAIDQLLDEWVPTDG